MRPTILTCAVTGNMTTLEQHPGLPVTPEQIADACICAGKAGAAIAHIHVREPSTGAPSMDIAYYRQVMERIAAAGSDIIINLTTGPGGRFVPSDDDPKIAAPSSTILPPEKRVEHIVELKPEISTLDLNTMNSGAAVVINTPRSVRIMAEMIRASGALPELEVFDSGDIHLGKALMKEGVLEGPGMFQIVTGVHYGAASTPETMSYMRSLLPQGAIWAGFGIGRMCYPMLAQAFLLGGHVRIGLEDGVYIEHGRLARDNAELCEKAVRVVRDLGGTLATPAVAREILGLRPRG